MHVDLVRCNVLATANSHVVSAAGQEETSLASRQISSNDARGVSFSDLFIGKFYHLT
jgi:hypothetical protein